MIKEPTTHDCAQQGQKNPDHRFLIGLVMGGAVGAGLTLLFAPRAAAELRQRVTDSTRDLGRAASDQYKQASTRVGDAVDELTRKGQGVRDEVLAAVASGAQRVERFATDHPAAVPHAR